MNKYLFLFVFVAFIALFNKGYAQSGDAVGFSNFADYPNGGNDSIFFYGNATIYAAGNVWLNTKVRFNDLKSNDVKNDVTPSDYNCQKAIFDNALGINFLFAGNVFEVAGKGSFEGNSYLSFIGQNNQEIVSSADLDNVGEVNLHKLQVANGAGLNLTNVNLKVAKNVNFNGNKLYLGGGKMVMKEDAFFSCYNTNGYVVAGVNTSSGEVGSVEKVAIKDSFEVPLGTIQDLTLIKVKMSEKNLSGADTIAFNLDTLTPNSPVDKSKFKYDEGLPLMIKIKNKTPRQNLTIDTIAIGVERDYLLDDNKVRNFVPSKGYITKYIGRENNVGGLETPSYWDAVNTNDPDIYRYSRTLQNDPTNLILTYARSGRMSFGEDNANPNSSVFGITTHEATPFKSIVKYWKIDVDNANCSALVTAEMSDYYYKGLKYQVYFTNKKEAERTDQNGYFSSFPFDKVEIDEATNRFSMVVPIIGMSQSVDRTKKIFANISQSDMFGVGASSEYSEAFETKCGDRAQTEEGQPPIVYVFSEGTNVSAIVEFRGIYSEEVNFKLYNVLGELEADLGNRSVKANEVTYLKFDLPSHITKNQRYLLVISGGLLNDDLRKYTVSLFVP